MLKVLKKETAILENKARFISELNSGVLKIQNKKREDVI
jgi:hypothetical protein